jgi:nitrite reductase/ring-hydroxylating ferredoxin subunit
MDNACSTQKARTPDSIVAARRVTFPPVPMGWYYLCRSGHLRTGPAKVVLGRSTFVAFRDTQGTVAVLEGRCSHMGADLSRGTVVGGSLRCPLHGWEYAADGRCVRIPASGTVPPLACQAVYPSVEIGGHILFHNAQAARFPMPFFDGVFPDDLRPAEPFDFVVNTPWYMIGANAFDLQHFRVAHDRTLVGTPLIDSPSPFARRIAATYDVTGRSVRDRLTRQFSGRQVRMTVTVWAGALILVTAAFRRTTSYGMVFVKPLDDGRSHLRTIVWVRRRPGALARTLLDPLDARIRRRFIRAFLMDDAVRSDGVRYNPATLIDADHEMREYFTALAAMSGEVPPRPV